MASPLIINKGATMPNEKGRKKVFKRRPGKKEYFVDRVGPVEARLLIGGRDESTGFKFVPNANLSFQCFSGKEKYFINLNRTGVYISDGFREKIRNDKVKLRIGDIEDTFTITENNEFEWDVVFYRRPAKNKIKWDLEFTHGIIFSYQPELTAEEIKAGHKRPNNIVGSYAVFIDQTDHILNARGETIVNYGTGKISHIYRPYAIDSIGNRVWCDLNIDQHAKKMIVTIPPGFLKFAKYPVRLDPIIGFDQIGATTGNFGGSRRSYYLKFNNIAAETGNAQAVYHYNPQSGGNCAFEIGYYVEDPPTYGQEARLLVDSGTLPAPTSAQWYSVSVTGELTQGTYYFPALGIDGGSRKNFYAKYDSLTDSSVSWGGIYPLPDTWTIYTPETYKFSLYLEYVQATSDLEVDDISHALTIDGASRGVWTASEQAGQPGQDSVVPTNNFRTVLFNPVNKATLGARVIFAAGSGSYTIETASIGKRVSGSTAEFMLPLTFDGGNPGFTIPSGTPKSSDWIFFNIEPGADYFVHWYISGPAINQTLYCHPHTNSQITQQYEQIGVNRYLDLSVGGLGSSSLCGVVSLSVSELKLTEHFTLDISDILHASYIEENFILFQKHFLEVQEINHQSYIDDTLLLNSKHYLLVDDIYHSVLVDDNIPLSIVVKLVIDNIIHSLLLDDSLDLFQKHYLTIDDIYHNLDLEGDLSLVGKHYLLIDAINHTLYLDDLLTLTSKHLLEVQSINHAVTIDEMLLFQKHLLELQSILHNVTIDGITLSTGAILKVDNIIHNLLIDTIPLTQKHYISVDNILHDVSIDQIKLVEQFLLEVQNIMHEVSIDQLTLIMPGIRGVLNALFEIYKPDISCELKKPVTGPIIANPDMVSELLKPGVKCKLDKALIKTIFEGSKKNA